MEFVFTPFAILSMSKKKGCHIHENLSPGKGKSLERCDELILKGISDMLCGNDIGKKENMYTNLFEYSESRDINSMPDDVFRIEYEYSKTSPSECRLSIYVISKHGDSFKKQSIEYTVPWENLPREIRSYFLKTDKNLQSFVFFSRDEIS